MGSLKKCMGNQKKCVGNIKEQNKKRRTIPLSIHVHHALIDGIHVGEFMEIFQKLMNETPDTDNQ